MTKTAQVYIDHHIAQLWGVNGEVLRNKRELLKAAQKTCRSLNLAIINYYIHQFKPHGLSLILIISESHFAIHTWPEFGYMHVDILSCSKNSKLARLKSVLKKEFKPQKLHCQKLNY